MEDNQSCQRQHHDYPTIDFPAEIEFDVKKIGSKSKTSDKGLNDGCVLYYLRSIPSKHGHGQGTTDSEER